MLYVIPFVVLLLVLIVLKKRESANKEQAEKSNKANSRKSSKKTTTRSSQTRQPQTNIVADDVILQKTTTPLKADFKKNIERLIQEKNYFSAEAKINQALNQDNSQHELYLYLLDLHQVHKDDLAIDQLLNHIRSLGLDDISAQAEAKQKAYEEQLKESAVDGINFNMPSTSTPPTTQNIPSTAAFDALVDPSPTKATSNSSFDVLASELSTEKTTSEETAVVPTLDLSEEIKEPQSTENKAELQPLDFNFSGNSDAPNVPEKAIEPVELEKTTTPDIQPLEFSFDLSPKVEEAPVTEKVTPVIDPMDSSPEFQLDLPEPITHETSDLTPQADVISKENTAPQIDNTLDFNFDLQKETDQEQPASLPELNFNFEPSISESAKVEVAESTTISAPFVEIAKTEPAPTATTQTHVDPLVQSFPELLSVNEAQLNLDLAEKYIELGVYDSARLLLNNTQDYSSAQREQSENLLRRIAS